MAAIVQKSSGKALPAGTVARDTVEDDVFDSVDLLKNTRLLSIKDDGVFEGLESWLHGSGPGAPPAAAMDAVKSNAAGAMTPNTEMLLSLMADGSEAGAAAAATGTTCPSQQQSPMTDDSLFDLYANLLNEISTPNVNKDSGNTDTNALSLRLESLSTYLIGSDLDLVKTEHEQLEALDAPPQADAAQANATDMTTAVVPRSRTSSPDKHPLSSQDDIQEVLRKLEQSQACTLESPAPSNFTSAPSNFTSASNTLPQADDTNTAHLMQKQIERMMLHQQQQQQQQQQQHQHQQQMQHHHWPQFDPTAVAGGYPTTLPGYPPPLANPYSTGGPQYPPYTMPGLAESMYAMSQRAAQAPLPPIYPRYPPPAAYLPHATAMQGMVHRPNVYSNPAAAAHHAAVMVRAAAMMSSPHYYPVVRPQVYANYPAAPPAAATAAAATAAGATAAGATAAGATAARASAARMPTTAQYNAAMGEHFQRTHSSPRRAPPILGRASSLKATAGKKIAPSVKRTSSQKSVASYCVSSASDTEVIQPLSTAQLPSTTFYVPPEPEPVQAKASPKPTSRHKKIPKATKKFMLNLRRQ